MKGTTNTTLPISNVGEFADISHGETLSAWTNLKHMKRVVKKLCWISAGILLLCFGWLVSERISGIRHLNAYLKSLRADGEKLDVAELEPHSRPDPTNNAAVALVALSNRFALIGDLTKSCPPVGRMITPGRAIAAQHIDRWYIKRENTNTWEQLLVQLKQHPELLGDKYITNTWEQLGRLLATHQDDLTAIQKALDKPGFDLGFDYHKDFDQPFSKALSHTMEFTTLLSTAALNEARHGNLSVAQSYLLSAVRLGSRQPNERLIIAQLIRQRVFVNSFNTLWALLPEPGWTGEQLEALQQAWTPINLPADLQASLEMERTMNINCFRLIEKTPGRLMKNLNQLTEVQSLNDATSWENGILSIIRPLQCVVWRAVWKEQDLLLTLKRMQSLVDQTRSARQGGLAALNSSAAFTNQSRFSPEEIESEEGLMTFWNRFRFPFATTDSPDTERIIYRTLCAQTKQQMMYAALACYRYHLATGVWPERLEQLVPKYLASVPGDPIGGGQLVYRPDSQKGFVLYSKGANGIDDDGDPTPVDDYHKNNLMDYGKDIVWPTAATPREADEALLNSQ